MNLKFRWDQNQWDRHLEDQTLWDHHLQEGKTRWDLRQLDQMKMAHQKDQKWEIWKAEKATTTRRTSSN